MDDCPLAKLPPELRDQIYDASLQFPQNVVVPVSRQSSDKPSADQNYRIAFHLLVACRQIYEESVRRLYASNTFEVVHNDGDVSCDQLLNNFIDRIGPTNAKALQMVRVHYTVTQGTIFNGQFRKHVKELRRIATLIPGCSVIVDMSFFDIYKSILFQAQLDLQNLGTISDENSWIGKIETNVATSFEERPEVQESMEFLRGYLRECRKDLELLV